MDIRATETGEVRTLSASQINKFYSCSRMWAYEYIEDLKPPPTFPMKKGTFIHAVIEQLNESLGALEGRSVQDLRVDLQEDALSIARDFWKQGLPGEFEEQMRERHSELQDQFNNYIEALLDRFQSIQRRTDLSDDDAWFRSRPSANELSILVTDKEGEWLFRGDVDSVFEKHPLWFDRTAIIDYKTGKSPFDDESPMSVDYSRQLDLYAWLFYQAFGSVPEVAGIHFLAEPPSNSTAFMFKEIDPGTIESTHLMLQRVRSLSTSEDLDDYSRNTQYKWCEFEKNNGEMIKCDHWDYCLGDEEMPEPGDTSYDGPDREPIEVVMRDPLEDDLVLTEHAAAEFEEFLTEADD